jgi:hypothetical protein
MEANVDFDRMFVETETALRFRGAAPLDLGVAPPGPRLWVGVPLISRPVSRLHHRSLLLELSGHFDNKVLRNHLAPSCFRKG